MKLQSLRAPPGGAHPMPWRRAWDAHNLPLTALLVAAAYAFGLQLSLAVRLPHSMFSPLWSPIAIVLAVLLLTPTNRWWIWLLVAIPAHLAIYLPLGSPLWRQGIQLTHNLTIVLIPAFVLRRFGREAVQLTTF